MINILAIDTGNTAWMLVCAAMVFLMTPGLAFFYAGLTRKKNIINTMMMSYIALAIVTIQWVVIGYSIAFGPSFWGIIGGPQYLGLIGINIYNGSVYVDSIPFFAFLLFQLMFAIICAAIISSAFAERMKFGAVMLFFILWTTFVYDLVAHWIWNLGGFLRALGALDFAGGMVIHISAGFSALVVALILGKRKDFQKHEISPHSIPYVLLGTGLLWFGWFAFNAGSALTAGGLATNAFLGTIVSGCAGGLVWMTLNWRKGKPSAIGFASGVLAGLASVTPAVGYVGTMEALIIGIVAGFICFHAVELRLKYLKVDESLDAWAIHGAGGVWGTIALGLFASMWINPNGTWGLIYGNVYFFLIQLLAIGVTIGVSMGVTALIMLALKYTIGIRVEEIEEYVGLDISEHGEVAIS